MTRSVPLVRHEPELNFSDPLADDFEALSRDRVPVRSLVADDLGALIAIDRRITGRGRASYYSRKVEEALEESGIRVSLVAEIERQIAGFIMARVDFGEFGHTEPEAVIDTIGVDPLHARAGGRHAAQPAAAACGGTSGPPAGKAGLQETAEAG